MECVMPQIKAFQDLEVWQLGMSLIEDCYRLTRNFPSDERFGLTSQIRRAAVSIPANIAEGYGRDQTGNPIQFLRIALGSACELETLLMTSVRLKFLSEADEGRCRTMTVRVCKMLRSLNRSREASKST
jgi:four helix bundle protein